MGKTKTGSLRISVAMVAFNEADNLQRSLPTVKFADEVIVVVDSRTTDATVAIAKSFGARVLVRDWLGYAKQKNLAIDQAGGAWILSLDADETVPPDSARAIQAAMATNDFDAYYLPRQTWFLGRWIRHGGWYPDWQLRLFKRGATRFLDVEVHERLDATPHTGHLSRAVLHHYSYRDLDDYFRRLNHYTSLEARARVSAERANGVKLVFKPVYRFLQLYVWHGGWRDGWPGFLIAAFSGVYVLVVHAKIFQLRSRQDQS